MSDTEDEFKAATEGGIDEADLSGLTEVDEEELPVDLEEKLPEEDLDPEAELEPIDEEQQETEEYIFASKYEDND